MRQSSNTMSKPTKPKSTNLGRKILVAMILYVLSFVPAVYIVDGNRNLTGLEPGLRVFYAPILWLVNPFLMKH